MLVPEQNEKREASDIREEDMTTVEELMDFEFGKRGEELREEFEKQVQENKK